MTTTRFLLLRHAEATGNLGGQTQGRIDNQLTERGRLQATTVAASLAPYSPVALYVSPASRARDTAAPIAQARGLAPVVDERLHEVDHGDLDGMGFDEIREHFAEFLEQWRDETFADLRFPGGESMGEARARMLEVLDEAAERRLQREQRERLKAQYRAMQRFYLLLSTSVLMIGRVDGVYANVDVVKHLLASELDKPGALEFDEALPHTRSAYHLSTLKHPEVIEAFNAWMKDRAGLLERLKKKHGLN